MVRIIFALLALGISSAVFASGCDENFFYDGTAVGQTVVKDYGTITPEEATKLVQQMTSIHRKALHSWTNSPVISSDVQVKMVTTEYKGLDTDCGWRHFGERLFITHLEIVTDQKSFFYPDIFKDIYAEFDWFGPDEYIRLEK